MPFEGTRDAIRLKRITHVALWVRDLERQTDFYSRVCGLALVDWSKRHIYMRAAETHHHVFELAADHKRVHHLSLQIDDDEDLERCAEILRAQGVQITLGPERDVEPGVGRLLRFLDPENHEIELVSEVAEFHEYYETNAVRPLSLNHALLYAGELTKQQSIYERVLGMRATDTIPRLMSFLRGC